MAGFPRRARGSTGGRAFGDSGLKAHLIQTNMMQFARVRLGVVICENCSTRTVLTTRGAHKRLGPDAPRLKMHVYISLTASSLESGFFWTLSARPHSRIAIPASNDSRRSHYAARSRPKQIVALLDAIFMYKSVVGIANSPKGPSAHLELSRRTLVTRCWHVASNEKNRTRKQFRNEVRGS